MCECDGLGVDFGVFSEDLTRRCTVKAPALASPQLGSCASLGRAWRLWTARHSQGEAQPQGAQP